MLPEELIVILFNFLVLLRIAMKWEAKYCYLCEK